MFEASTIVSRNQNKQKKEKSYSLEEYLAMEERSGINHEFYNGKLIPMAGGTPKHSKIKGLVITALNNAIRSSRKNHDVYNSDIRVNLPAIDRVVMPDGAVVVGKAEFTIEKPVGLLANPTLIVEVFSKSTEGYDRGDKFKRYRTLPSFNEYLLVSQEKPLVEIFYKKEGEWVIGETAEGIESKIHLNSLDIDLSLADIYWGVEFEQGAKAKKEKTKK